MLSRQLISSLSAMVPNKGPATVTLNANTGSPVTVTVANAWAKQTSGGLRGYGGVNIEQDKTIIKILDSELNPVGNGYQIRAEDEILFDGTLYCVTEVGGNLRTSRTTWDCGVQKKIT